MAFDLQATLSDLGSQAREIQTQVRAGSIQLGEAAAKIESLDRLKSWAIGRVQRKTPSIAKTIQAFEKICREVKETIARRKMPRMQSPQSLSYGTFSLDKPAVSHTPLITRWAPAPQERGNGNGYFPASQPALPAPPPAGPWRISSAGTQVLADDPLRFSGPPRMAMEASSFVKSDIRMIEHEIERAEREDFTDSARYKQALEERIADQKGQLEFFLKSPGISSTDREKIGELLRRNEKVLERIHRHIEYPRMSRFSQSSAACCEDLSACCSKVAQCCSAIPSFCWAVIDECCCGNSSSRGSYVPAGSRQARLPQPQMRWVYEPTRAAAARSVGQNYLGNYAFRF